jgi:hypothetical protein
LYYLALCTVAVAVAIALCIAASIYFLYLCSLFFAVLCLCVLASERRDGAPRPRCSVRAFSSTRRRVGTPSRRCPGSRHTRHQHLGGACNGGTQARPSGTWYPVPRSKQPRQCQAAKETHGPPNGRAHRGGGGGGRLGCAGAIWGFTSFSKIGAELYLQRALAS